MKEVAVGETKVSLELEYDDETIGVDFRLVEPEAFYHTLQHFTGSKDHNIRIRQLAKAQNEKVSEYGIEQQDGTLLNSKVKLKFTNTSVDIGLLRQYVKMAASLIVI